MLRLATHAMGTRFELVLGGEESSNVRSIGELLFREIELWHDRLSRFQPDSDIARLNRDGGGQVDAELLNLLELCDVVRETSDGTFDVCIGSAMEQLGFHPPSPAPRGTPHIGDRRMKLERDRSMVSLGSGCALDLGAVAKGFALDLASTILREHRIGCALLHGGTSSVVAIGSPDGSQGWPVAVRSEDKPLQISLQDQAMSVSAPRGRTISPKGSTESDIDTKADSSDLEREATHILDPRTGRPARAADTAVVVGPLGSGALCDAWSTALVVLGSRPATMPPELTTHLHSPGTGWRTLTALTSPC